MIEDKRLRRNRAFVLLATAQAIRGLAFWLCWLGMLSLASFTLHASAGQIALVIASTSLPHIALFPFAGAIVDRTNGKWVFVITLFANALTATFLVMAHHMWEMYLAGLSLSTAAVFVWPALGSMLKQITGEQTMARGTGIVNSVWEASLIAGPPAAGLLATAIGPRVPMEVGTGLYLTALVVLLPMRFVPSKAPKPQPGTRLKELRQGIAIIFRLPDLRALALWGALAWAGFNVVIAVEPVLVRQVLHGGSSMLGWFYSVQGIGSTIGSLAIGWLIRQRKELRGAATGLIIVALLYFLYLTHARFRYVLPIQFLLGIGFAAFQTLSQVLVQRRSPDVSVGRVLSAKRGIEEMAAFSAALIAGGIASSFGARHTMMVAAALVGFAGAVMFMRSIRIEPEIDAGNDKPAIPIEPGGGDPLHDRAGIPIRYD